MNEGDSFRLVIVGQIADMVIYTTQCERERHIQQVAWSTYHRGLTQICFTCETVRTNIIEKP